jgi:hypothetical protein
MKQLFELPDAPENCAIVQMGRELGVTALINARKICDSGLVKRMQNRIKVATINYGPQELPYFREISWRSSRLSARMSPPIPKTAGLLTTRKIGNSEYSHLIEHGIVTHTCDKENSLDQRPCTACTMTFWENPYPIERTILIPSLNETRTALCAVGGHVKEKTVKKKKVGGTETEVEEVTTTEWVAPEEDPRVTRVQREL